MRWTKHQVDWYSGLQVVSLHHAGPSPRPSSSPVWVQSPPRADGTSPPRVSCPHPRVPYGTGRDPSGSGSQTTEGTGGSSRDQPPPHRPDHVQPLSADVDEGTLVEEDLQAAPDDGRVSVARVDEVTGRRVYLQVDVTDPTRPVGGGVGPVTAGGPTGEEV